jgi:hypothetical protein
LEEIPAMTIVAFPRCSSPAPMAPLDRCRSKEELIAAAGACCRRDDPIYVLIHAHEESCRQWSDAVDFEEALLPHHLGMRLVEAETVRREDIMCSLFADLLHERPITVEGVIHFCRYLIELRKLNECELSKANMLDALANVAAALEAITTAPAN